MIFGFYIWKPVSSIVLVAFFECHGNSLQEIHCLFSFFLQKWLPFMGYQAISCDIKGPQWSSCRWYHVVVSFFCSQRLKYFFIDLWYFDVCVLFQSGFSFFQVAFLILALGAIQPIVHNQIWGYPAHSFHPTIWGLSSPQFPNKKNHEENNSPHKNPKRKYVSKITSPKSKGNKCEQNNSPQKNPKRKSVSKKNYLTKI